MFKRCINALLLKKRDLNEVPTFIGAEESM